MMSAGLRFGLHSSDLLMRTLRYGRYSVTTSIKRIELAKAMKPGGMLPPSHPNLFNLGLLGIGILAWIGAALLAGFAPADWRIRATFAIVFGPPGTILRFYLARLNPLRTSFPLGTFAANMLGTALEAVFALLLAKGNIVSSALSCAALQGLNDVSPSHPSINAAKASAGLLRQFVDHFDLCDRVARAQAVSFVSICVG